jgi:hypothetical protein
MDSEEGKLGIRDDIPPFGGEFNIIEAVISIFAVTESFSYI